MKDIDFDELDRAVSSVLGQSSPKDDAPTVQTTKNTEEPAVEETSATLDAPAAEVPSAPTVAAEPTVSPAPPLAIKRRGKFMDVMHPSSDMAPTTSTSAAKPLRSAPEIKPLTAVQPEPVAEPAPAVEQAVEPTAEVDESHALIGAEPAPVESMLPEHVSDEATSSTASLPEVEEATSPEPASVTQPTDSEAAEPAQSLYVDPLEMTQPAEPGASPAEEPLVPEDSTEKTEDDLQPAMTPFLADTKVDKRPLGAFGDADSVAVPSTEPGAESAEQTTVNTQAAPTVSLPRELQPDVVEVESSAQEAEITPATVSVGTASAEAKTDSADDGRVEGHPLFDTSTYHEPIAAVHGKGLPGWAKWLIGLLVCLALGAGVGYFLFTAGL